MKRTFLFKLFRKTLQSLQNRLFGVLFFIFLCSPSYATQTYVSLVPSVTEILYALGLEDGLVGVSQQCNYPKEAKNKENLGSLYGLNKEKLLKMHPDFVFALDASRPFLGDFEGHLQIKYFTFNSVNDILCAIEEIGELLGARKQARALAQDIKKEIKPYGAGKSVLYVVQSEPLITIGKNSYLTDVIRLSGNVSATKDIAGHYPSVTAEYIARLNPDYVVIGPYADGGRLHALFGKKNVKFITLNKEQNDIINRPGARIGKAIQFFGTLK